MDKNTKKRKKKIASIAVIAAAFVLCIMATFGVTMAYFGGSSAEKSGSLTLKSAVWVNSSEMASFSGTVVPSQKISQNCLVKVKSADASTGAALTNNRATNAVMRAQIKLTLPSGLGISDPTSGGSLDVKVGSTVVAKFMKDTTDTTNGYWYLMDKSATAVTGNLYEINTASGEVSLTYTLSITIPASIKNSTLATAGSNEIKVTVKYTVIQSEIYDANGTAVAKTQAAMKSYFSSSDLDADAKY